MLIFFAFFLATAASLLQGVLLPGFSLFAYAPWLALITLRCSSIRALWGAILAGAFVDLLSDHPFGLHAIAFATTSFLLLRFRKHFFFDRPLHLSLFSALISELLTLLQLFLLFLFDRRVPFSGKWVLGDLLAMPIVDGFYALIWFAGPLALFEKLRRQWGLFWLKKKNLSPT